MDSPLKPEAREFRVVSKQVIHVENAHFDVQFDLSDLLSPREASPRCAAASIWDGSELQWKEGRGALWPESMGKSQEVPPACLRALRAYLEAVRGP